MNTCKRKDDKESVTLEFERNGKEISVTLKVAANQTKTISHAQFQKEYDVIEEAKVNE